MLTLFIIIVLNFVTFSIAFITATHKISDNRRNKFKWLNKKGWLVIICGVLSIILPAFQYWLNLKADLKKEANTKFEQNKKDSLTNVINENNKNKIIITFTDALAKYGLKYDSTEKVIAKLVHDSANRITTIVNANEPDLDFCPSTGVEMTSQTNENYNFKIHICSLVGSSYNVNLTLKYLIKYSQGNYLKIKDATKIGQSNLKISADTEFGYPVFVVSNELPEKIYFLLSGTYTNINRTKSYPVSSISVYILASKQYGIPIESEYSKVKDLFLK